MLGTTRVALGDVKYWLLSPAVGESVVKSIRLCAEPIRTAPAISPINWKSPTPYRPLMPRRGPAPVNIELTVYPDEARNARIGDGPCPMETLGPFVRTR